jgi:ribosome-binding protein aMBF1 (putative translation factor)
MNCELCGVSITPNTTWHVYSRPIPVSVCDDCNKDVTSEVMYTAPIQLIRDAVETIRRRRKKLE